MKPTMDINQTGGRVMPSCTTARGRTETLLRGRDSLTRFGPTATAARPTPIGDTAPLPARRAK